MHSNSENQKDLRLQQLQKSIHSTADLQAKPVGLADRVLLCIPHGGLNDTLVQIQQCLRYAERFDRQLVIDARRSGLMGHFSEFFVMHSTSVDVIGSPDKRQLEILNTWDSHPEQVRGRLHETKRTHCKNRRGKTTISVDENSESILSFDFSLDYPQPLIVHEQSGGGDCSDLLHKIALADDVATTITARLSKLPSEYLGVHVRNTDLMTDYKSFFRDIYPHTMGRKILVCSDDNNVIRYARRFFDRSEVITTDTFQGDFEMLDRVPLHKQHHKNDAERKAQMISSLADLLALGRASDVLTTKCSSRDRHSGFSRVALYLCRNKHVLASLQSSPLAMSTSQVRNLVADLDRARIETQDSLFQLRRRLEKYEETKQKQGLKLRRLEDKLREARDKLREARGKLREARAQNSGLGKALGNYAAIRAWARRRI